MRRAARLGRSFYTRADTLAVARELLGKRLVVPAPEGERVSARIVEVEAYCGVEDKAAHSYGNRRTARTETMYMVGGTAYVFFVYGMHHQFNVVVGPKEVPHAVLVRAVEPVEGVEWMRRRRPVKDERELTSGPGKLCRALGIDRSYDGADLLGRRVWIEDADALPSEEIATGARIGVAYAGADALKPWRFWVKGSVYVSRREGKQPQQPNQPKQNG
ncbi:MAG TPA: DNA-3-methyladenine glycosylase [Pyrinomonadaceae bacterium]|nr:DNA-3-methyladenine glycosylase [Pyrinomonadaceae bacterium]